MCFSELCFTITLVKGFKGHEGCEEAHSEDDGGEGNGTSIVRPEIIFEKSSFLKCKSLLNPFISLGTCDLDQKKRENNRPTFLILVHLVVTLSLLGQDLKIFCK